MGRNYDCPDDLDKVPEKLIWEIININVGAATYLTRLVLPQMKKHKKGAIINISSGSDLQPLPYMTVYAATKVSLRCFRSSFGLLNNSSVPFQAYIKNFTLALRHELAEYNITVQLVSPMFVQTKMNNFSQTVMTSKNLFIPDVESYTKFAVFTLGKTNTTTGYWSHGIQVSIAAGCQDRTIWKSSQSHLDSHILLSPQYGAAKIMPEFIRTIIGCKMNKDFREEYIRNNKVS